MRARAGGPMRPRMRDGGRRERAEKGTQVCDTDFPIEHPHPFVCYRLFSSESPVRGQSDRTTQPCLFELKSNKQTTNPQPASRSRRRRSAPTRPRGRATASSRSTSRPTATPPRLSAPTISTCAARRRRAMSRSAGGRTSGERAAAVAGAARGAAVAGAARGAAVGAARGAAVGAARGARALLVLVLPSLAAAGRRPCCRCFQSMSARSFLAGDPAHT